MGHLWVTKYIIIAVLLGLASPYGLSETPILGDLIDIPDLAEDAQFCELDKPKKGRFTEIRKCRKGDLLFYGDHVKPKNADHFMRICEYGTITQSQITPVIGGFDSYIFCIYRGSEMPVRQ